ncbi:MAG: UDP binding domain-containing protein, partial [Bosea sp. (in: a-proteobacteria)]
DRRKERMAQKIITALGNNISGKRIAVLGLAFKPNTDDMRDAPSLVIIPALQKAGASIAAYDPESITQARPLLPGVDFAQGPYQVLDGADALVIITEWNAFRALDLSRVKSAMRSPVVIDLRNIYRPAEMRALGFAYHGVGRGLSA